jgi:hypothetical protein
MFVYIVNHEHRFTDVVGVFASEFQAKKAAEKYVDWLQLESIKKIEDDKDEHHKTDVFRRCRKVLYSNDTDIITINYIRFTEKLSPICEDE